jgi:hypothetical protein
MFLFDCESPSVLYTAEESGLVHRIDLRTNTAELLFVNKARQLDGNLAVSFRRSFSTPGAVKVLAQSPHLGASQLIVGGRGFDVGMLDLRLASRARHQIEGEDVSARFDCGDFVRTWSPCHPSSERDRNSISSPAVREVTTETAYRSVSASGLQLSKDARSMVVSYQGDQIYTFDVRDNGREEHSGGATAIIGGHINYSTFLKNVSFFGPRDECVVAGSDSGHIWVWEARPEVDTNNMTCRLVTLLKAGEVHFHVQPHDLLTLTGR